MVKFTVTNHLQTNEWRICCGARNTDPLDHLNQYLKERLSTLIPGTLNRDFNNHCESNLESFPWHLSLPHNIILNHIELRRFQLILTR